MIYNNICNGHSGDVLFILECVEDVLQLCEEEGGVVLLEHQRGPQSPDNVTSQYQGVADPEILVGPGSCESSDPIWG